MNNSFKMNTFNSLDIKDKKDNICLYFDFNIMIKDANLNNFFDNYGLTKNKLNIVINNFLKYKNINQNITFIEHHKKTKIKLSITGSCIDNFKSYYFNYKNSPNMKIIDAIVISCNIPLIFNPIKYNNKLNK